MKKTTFIITNILVFIFALILVLGLDRYGGELSYFLVFPLVPLARFLRTLSLSDAMGNIIAWIIYGLVTLSPLIVLAVLYLKKRFIKLDLLLVVLSLALGFSLYYLINPFDGLSFTSYYALSPLILSILLSYLLLRIIYKLRQGDLKTLSCYSGYLLIIFMIVFAFAAYFSLIYSLKNASGHDALLEFTNFLKALISAVTYGLVSYILKKIADLCLLYRHDQYHKELPSRLKKINKLLIRTILIISISQVFLNLFYVILGANISDVNTSISFPFLALAFLLIGLFVMRLFEDLLILKDDNDLMI